MKWLLVTLIAAVTTNAQAPDPRRIPVVFTGGHETDPRDHGRPVALIAAALNVPADVFREAFSHVTPAPGGREPDPWQVQMNKAALLKALAPYGITNDRLDQVSDYYRYNPGRGSIWRNSAAVAYAIVRGGVVTEVVVANPGSSYSSTPVATISEMPNVRLQASISFTTNPARNGAIAHLAVSNR